ncbi:hypothetical protein [Rugosimonospora africana]|nr:hypothetical protein [Rugosimonospora africana]
MEPARTFSYCGCTFSYRWPHAAGVPAEDGNSVLVESAVTRGC